MLALSHFGLYSSRSCLVCCLIIEVQHWSIIESATCLNEIFPMKLAMVVRRPTNLRDLRVRAKLKPNPTDDHQGDSWPWGRKKCKTCGLHLERSFRKAFAGFCDYDIIFMAEAYRRR